MSEPGDPPDPGTEQSFLDAVAACTWTATYLVTVSGAHHWPRVNRHPTWPEGVWGMSSTANYTMSQATFNLLAAGTAGTNALGQPDGSFWSGGVRYWLHNTPSTLVAVQVTA